MLIPSGVVIVGLYSCSCSCSEEEASLDDDSSLCEELSCPSSEEDPAASEDTLSSELVSLSAEEDKTDSDDTLSSELLSDCPALVVDCSAEEDEGNEDDFWLGKNWQEVSPINSSGMNKYFFFILYLYLVNAIANAGARNIARTMMITMMR